MMRMMRVPDRRRRRTWAVIAAMLLSVLLIAMSFISLPYYIYSPGSAESLQPLVTVQGGHRNARGSFLLTTVYVVYAANVYDFLYGLFLPHRQIIPASQLDPGLSDAQFNAIEDYMMKASHQDAEIVAMRFLHKPIRVSTTGVRVVYVEKGSRAFGQLLPGDVLTQINGITLRTPATLFRVLAGAKVGQRVALTVLRGNRSLHLRVALIALPPLAGAKQARVGIGFTPAVARKVDSPIRIRINSGDINGPSAGLMFTLEVINQLYTGGDLTRGYRIAGTGTIDENGVIGQIGGVAHKVIAANNAHAAYFFVPMDMQPGDTNELHAKQEAATLHTSMKIIPVHTLRQAVLFLQSLSPHRV